MNHNHTPLILPSRRNRQQDLTIPDILFTRQLYGFQRTNELSGRIGWNKCRMQNMILSIGPGTPASVLMDKQPHPNTDSDDAGSDESDNSDEMSQDSNHDDDENHSRLAIDSCDTESETFEEQENEQQLSRLETAQRALMAWEDSGDRSQSASDYQEPPEDDLRGILTNSIRHGGCINTACWLTVPWRLSLRGGKRDALESEECPTQLITSGDDRLVKFWDVRHAMGSTSPLPGGRSTFTPFSSNVPLGPPMEEWTRTRPGQFPHAGSVIPLATLDTRHQGNVFHVTPLSQSPGKVVTCAADGYLRVSDLESGTSSIVVSPEYISYLPTPLSLRPGMCFSHHFLDTNTGLLCSERGLRRFDLRTQARDQRSTLLLGNAQICKACAIWSADDVESSYVFCGGASATVALYDLRMADSLGSRVVQRYLPRELSSGAKVSVSGLDLSKDKRELLVSYESDHIYTFPIFPSNTATPTVDELTEYACAQERDKDLVQPDLASFGGHFNRFTFLKNAKYAGPNDEYICTGSDSGHAWIYERATGAVSSFLNADHSTCNGVIPHPTLPFFLTYGIDSTAKLWRATPPTDSKCDDSPLGRARHYKKLQYEKSPIVAIWNDVAFLLESIDSYEEIGLIIRPDDFPRNDEGKGVMNEHNNFSLFRTRQLRDSRASFIGNDIGQLPEVLRQNFFACIMAIHTGREDSPILSSLSELKRRIGVIRLNHQAAQRGLVMPMRKPPWLMEHRPAYFGSGLVLSDQNEVIGSLEDEKTTKPQYGATLQYGDVVDLIPQYPGDWLPYFDSEMLYKPTQYGLNINLDRYGHLPLLEYDVVRASSTKWTAGHLQSSQAIMVNRTPAENQSFLSLPVIPTRTRHEESESMQSNKSSKEAINTMPSLSTMVSSHGSNEEMFGLLYQTVELLKDGGNLAFKANAISLAASRYDLALQYCAMAFMSYPEGLSHVLIKPFARFDKTEWSPLLKMMIMIRLNLSMVFLRTPCRDPKSASEQAKVALKELEPFVRENGKVPKRSSQMDRDMQDGDYKSIFAQAKDLQAKALYRLGCALLALGDYGDAVMKLRESIKCTRELDGEPESIVLRRLADAKREHDKITQQQRKRFKTIFSQGLDDMSQSQKPAEINVTDDSGSAAITAPVERNETQVEESADTDDNGEFRFNFTAP